jgi:glycerone phosphate O-acyltransferase
LDKQQKQQQQQQLRDKMEGFCDLLDEIKSAGGPLLWITQKKKFLQHESAPKRSAEQLKQSVLTSARLRHTIEQLVAKGGGGTGRKHDEILAEARKILDEMAHDIDLKYVRFLGYVVMKVLVQCYKHVYYNAEAESHLKIIKQYPTLLLPLHRSYMDFLIVSIVCFHLNVQLPAIAAGEDFLGLSFLSNVIRHTGAFFIRRSFGSDELYWAIFHEYVQQHLTNCDRPLEFFIEGMRSRTSKSILPKQGYNSF